MLDSNFKAICALGLHYNHLEIKAASLLPADVVHRGITGERRHSSDLDSRSRTRGCADHEARLDLGLQATQRKATREKDTINGPNDAYIPNFQDSRIVKCGGWASVGAMALKCSFTPLPMRSGRDSRTFPPHSTPRRPPMACQLRFRPQSASVRPYIQSSPRSTRCMTSLPACLYDSAQKRIHGRKRTIYE